MPDVTDPTAIKAVREVLRPLCEDARALKARIDALSVTWYAGLNSTIGTGSGVVQEGRESEGVDSLTQDEVTNAVANLIAAATALNDQIISKPCVRTFTAN